MSEITLMVFNKELIAERGGNLCGQDRFNIQACDHCQGHYLYNAELNDVYYDSADLSRRFFKVPGLALPPCAYCGTLAWDFSPMAPDQTAVQTGPWSWVLASRQFTFS